MYIITLISSLLPAVLSNHYAAFTPCDCFDVSLEDGYPRADYGGICYQYNINKKLSNDDCPADLDYYIIGSGYSYECPVELTDIAQAITWSTNDEYVIAPYRGKHDGTNVNGVKIAHCAELSTFTICFDQKKVDGVQSQGTIGLVDTNGNAARCTLDNILPNFCVTNTPQPTTAKPTTAAPTTANPTTAAPTTAQPTTANPTTSSPTTANPTTSAPTTADPTTANPTTSEPTMSPTCTSNPEDRIFSCECFDNDPEPETNCPRSQCVYDYPSGEGRGCEPIPAGVGGGDPNNPQPNNPIQCDTRSPDCGTGDQCVGDAVCGGAQDFGCCKAPPEAMDDSTIANEGQTITIEVLTNDSDPDGDDFDIINVGTPSNGGSVSYSNKTIEYTPSSTTCTDIAPATTFTDRFEYTIRDSDGLSDATLSTAEVTVIVTCDRPAITAEDDSGSTDVDKSVDVPVLSNDSDPDGDELTIISTSTPNYGTVTIDNDNDVIEYTPNDAATAECAKCAGDIQDTFTYTIQDEGDKQEATATVTIDIKCLCVNPVAVNDVDSTDDETPIPINVLSNDQDPDSVGISVNTITTQPDIGSAQIVGNQIVYTPGIEGQNKCDEIATSANPDYFITTLTYNIITNSPVQLTSNDATVTITVTCIRVPPIADDDSASVNEGQSVDIPVLDNDSDPDDSGDDTISIAQITTGPSKGTAVINDDGTITYTPNNVCNRSPNLGKNKIIDSFEYTIIDEDDNLLSEPALVTIEIICNRQCPVAIDDYYTTTETQSIPTYPVDNDSDPDGGSLVITSVYDPNIGSITRNGNTITYTPDDSYCDSISTPSYTASFLYTITDSDDDQMTASATVYITVNCDRTPPTAVDDTAKVSEGSSVDIPVLTNDYDADGGNIDIVNVTAPQNGGSVIINDDNTITYTPSATGCSESYYGSTSYMDTFTYTIIDDDDGYTDTATVTVRITCYNRPPIAKPNSATTDEDTSVLIRVLRNDYDPEGGDLTITRIVSQPSNGIASVGVEPDEIDKVIYTPNPDFCGATDVFIYEISDEEGETAQARVRVYVRCINDEPNAVDDAVEVEQGEYVVINVLDNDTDIDDDDDTLIIVPGSIANGPFNGDAVINEDNTITYTPDPDYCGSDTFTYDNQDISGAVSTATVTITINCCPPIPLPPIAVDDTAVTEEGKTVNIDVLDNDYDPDDLEEDVLLNGIVTDPANGIAVQLADGTIDYTPNDGWCGVDRFEYRIIDIDDGLTDVATVCVTVNCNQAPVAIPDRYVTDQDVPIRVYPLKNDYDPEGGEVHIVTIPGVPRKGGSVSVYDAENGVYTYTPPKGVCGISDGFEYIIADDRGKQARSAVIVQINCCEVVEEEAVDYASSVKRSGSKSSSKGSKGSRSGSKGSTSKASGSKASSSKTSKSSKGSTVNTYTMSGTKASNSKSSKGSKGSSSKGSGLETYGDSVSKTSTSKALKSSKSSKGSALLTYTKSSKISKVSASKTSKGSGSKTSGKVSSLSKTSKSSKSSKGSGLLTYANLASKVSKASASKSSKIFGTNTYTDFVSKTSNSESKTSKASKASTLNTYKTSNSGSKTSKSILNTYKTSGSKSSTSKASKSSKSSKGSAVNTYTASGSKSDTASKVSSEGGTYYGDETRSVSKASSGSGTKSDYNSASKTSSGGATIYGDETESAPEASSGSGIKYDGDSASSSGSGSGSGSGSASSSEEEQEPDTVQTYYGKSVMLPFDEGNISKDIIGDSSDKYNGYIVIAVITLLFNIVAYMMTYMCCIRGMVKNKHNTASSTKHGYSFANKELDESDMDDLNHDF